MYKQYLCPHRLNIDCIHWQSAYHSFFISFDMQYFYKRSIIYINLIAMDWGHANTSQTFPSRIIDNIFTYTSVLISTVYWQTIASVIHMFLLLYLCAFFFSPFNHQCWLYNNWTLIYVTSDYSNRLRFSAVTEWNEIQTVSFCDHN